MSKTYAIADLHGRFDLLEMTLAKIANHAELPATLVTLGDYVDRGPDSRKVIGRLMGGLGHEGWRLICLKGNHEDIMWQTCRRKVPDCGWWLDNGGGATLISYGQNEGDQADVTVVLDEHLKWIERLPLMHVDKHRIFVHAGVNPNYPLDEQDPQERFENIQPAELRRRQAISRRWMAGFRDLPRSCLRQRATTLGPKGVRQARDCCNGCHRCAERPRGYRTGG